MTSLVPALIAGAIAAGALMMVSAFLAPAVRPAKPGRRPGWARQLVAYYGGNTPAAWLRRISAVGSVAAGAVVWLLNGWFAAVILIPAVVVGVPFLLRNPVETNTIERLDALQEWTRGLAGVLDVGVGLEQAITTSVRSAPDAIAEEVRTLAAKLNAGADTRTAVRAFAAAIGDNAGDYVALALMRASEQRGPGLAIALQGLAATVAEQVAQRRESEAEKAKPRTSARWSAIVIGGMVGLAWVFNRDYLEPYTTGQGQIILMVLLSALAGCLLWMRRSSRVKPMPRLLDPTVESAPRRAR